MSGVVDRERVARAVRELLSAIGENPDSAELSGTPARVADAYAEFFSIFGEVGVETLVEGVAATWGVETGFFVSWG